MFLTDLSEEERAKALERYTLLQPYLEGHCSLQHLSKTVGLKYRTARRWVQAYHEKGLAGLVRKSRRDKGHARLHPTLQSLIEGLALQKTRPSADSIPRSSRSRMKEQRRISSSSICSIDDRPNVPMRSGRRRPQPVLPNSYITNAGNGLCRTSVAS